MSASLPSLLPSPSRGADGQVGGGAHGRLLRRRGRCVTGDCASVLSCSVSGEPPRCPSKRLHARLLTRRRRRLPRPVARRRVQRAAVPVSFQTTNGGGAVDITVRYVPPRAPCPRRQAAALVRAASSTRRHQLLPGPVRGFEHVCPVGVGRHGS